MIQPYLYPHNILYYHIPLLRIRFILNKLRLNDLFVFANKYGGIRIRQLEADLHVTV